MPAMPVRCCFAVPLPRPAFVGSAPGARAACVPRHLNSLPGERQQFAPATEPAPGLVPALVFASCSAPGAAAVAVVSAHWPLPAPVPGLGHFDSDRELWRATAEAVAVPPRATGSGQSAHRRASSRDCYSPY